MIADDVCRGVTMGDCREDEERPVRYAARQPILAIDETVIGYKLLFRTDVVNHFSVQDANCASRTAIDASSLLGLDVLCDNRLAFISCTRDVLLENSLAFLPADKVVAEIRTGVTADEAVEDACRDLKNAGFKIALDDFAANDPREPLTHFADFIKVDIRHRPWEDIQRIARTHGNHSFGLVADKVETWEEFDHTRQAGFQFFQGYFFRKPETMRTRVATSNRTIYLRLLRAISRPEMDWREVEELIKKDAALYFRLLRYLNSAALGIRSEVRSVNQALNYLGENELRRWCRLAGAFEMSKHRPSDLMLSALVRAQFGELMASKVEHGDADLFLVGLLSMMDAILEIPMSAVIDGLALDLESVALLQENHGPLQPIYELIWALERGVWRSVLRICNALKLDEREVAKAYTSAMEWAQSVTAGE